ncbi:MAG: hypothetical protein AAFQ08_01605, partial [Bacteroidota bacterium]
KNFLICVIFLNTVLHTSSGAPSTPENTLNNTEFIIEKERALLVPDANRLFENAPVAPRLTTPPQQPLLSTPLPTIAPTWTLLNRKTKILRAQQDVVTRLYSNCVQGGYGNFYTPYLEGHFGSKRHPKYAYGLHFRHLSFGKDQYGEESNNTLQAHGKVLREQWSLGGSVQYDRDGYTLYHLPTALAQHQVVHQCTALGTLAQRFQGLFNYQLQVGFHYLRDRQQVQEGQLGLKGVGDYELNDNFTWRVASALHWSRYAHSQAVYRHWYRLKPTLDFSWNALAVQGGVRLVYQHGAIGKVSAFNAYPVLEVGYELQPWLRPYAGVGGDMEHNTWQSLMQENPLLAPGVTLKHTHQRVTLYGGVKGDVLAQIAFHAGLVWGEYHDLPCFVNHTTKPGYFEVCYAPEATMLNAFTELTHTNSAETWTTRLRGDYFYYKLKKLQAPWHRPQYQLAWFSTYRLYDKIVFKGSLCWMGGLSAWDAQQGKAHKLDDVVDLGVGIDYWWNTRFSLFLNCQNLLARANEQYWHYPARGRHFLIGLSYAW